MDQELELGLRSVAAPLRADGRTIAALNVAVAAPRVALDELRETILPELLSAAERISAALEHARAARPVTADDERRDARREIAPTG
jgi:IclR family pca regulon transcriptional regulator